MPSLGVQVAGEGTLGTHRLEPQELGPPGVGAPSTVGTTIIATSSHSEALLDDSAVDALLLTNLYVTEPSPAWTRTTEGARMSSDLHLSTPSF